MVDFVSSAPGTSALHDAAAETTRFTARQLLVAALCFLCLVLDGFDVQAMGYVAPAVIADWGIDRTALTPVFSAGLLGMLVGSVLLSTLADRVGRRTVLIGCTAFFGLCMLTTTLVTTIPQLVAIRFITGLGLGGIMPNALALVSEYSPARRRISVMMIVACGFTLGAALGGLAAVGLIALSGWKSVFLVGGIAPVALVAAMLIALPESEQFRLRRKDGTGVPKAALPSSGIFTALFADARGRGTIVLWGLNFCNLLGLYFLSSWLPTLLSGAQFPTSVAILVGTVVQVGGITGTFAMGVLIDRLGFARVLVPVFAIAALSLWAIGQATTVWTLYPIAFCAGFCIVGGQPALNSMAAAFYPLGIRSTGIGWSLGVGRIGSVVGPVAGGLLVAANLGNAAIFAALAVPAVICGGLMLLMPMAGRKT